jgi:branched-chain amino acid aminotransferase
MMNESDVRYRIWRDGQFVNWEDATIHVVSHVVHYGSSIFEGIRCYATPEGPAVFRLDDHMRRFHDSCRIYRMPLRYSIEELAQAAVDTVTENNLPHCYIRPVAMRITESRVMPWRIPEPTVDVYSFPSRTRKRFSPLPSEMKPNESSMIPST